MAALVLFASSSFVIPGSLSVDLYILIIDYVFLTLGWSINFLLNARHHGCSVVECMDFAHYSKQYLTLGRQLKLYVSQFDSLRHILKLF